MGVLFNIHQELKVLIVESNSFLTSYSCLFQLGQVVCLVKSNLWLYRISLNRILNLSNRIRGCLFRIFDLEMKALATGSRLTTYGIYFDEKVVKFSQIRYSLIWIQLCEEKLPQMRKRLEYIASQCAHYAGHSIDVESSREVAAVSHYDLPFQHNLTDFQLLFDILKLPYPGKKTKRGQRSTSREILEAIVELHPLPGLLIEYRRISYSISVIVFV